MRARSVSSRSYIVYLVLSGSGSTEGGDPATLLATLLPDRLVPTTLSLYPLFGTAIMLILGAVLAGGEFRWGVWGTLFNQGPVRAAVVLSKIAAMAVVVVVGTFVLVVVAGTIIAVIEGRPLDWPGPGPIALGLGSAWLVSLAVASLGFFLAIAFRGIGTALGVGLVWLLALENTVNGLSFLLEVGPMQKVLLGPSAGSLAAALGTTTQDNGGTPGVVATASPLVACLVLGAYIAVFAVLSIRVTIRRDQT